MRIVYLNSDSPYIIGKQGETNAVTLRVDVTEWAADYPDGTGVILFTRPNKVVYPLETNKIVLDGKTYLQTIVTTKENKVPGWVVLQAQWYNGDVLVKSMLFSGKVLVSGDSTPVDPTETVPSWVTEWMDTLREAIDGAALLIDAAETMNEDLEASHQAVSDSEAWAKGTRSGEAVEPTDETYHNNSKYYSEQIASTAEDVEAWANGTRHGTDIDETDPAYHKNGKYYSTQAAASAAAAAASASEAMTDTPEGYANVVASISPTYDGTKTYAVGAYCLNGGKLYRCTTAIDEPEAVFNSAHWAEVNVGGEVSDLKSANDYYRPFGGKNILDLSDVVSGSINSSGKIVANNAFSTNNYIPVEPNTAYISSVDGVSGTNLSKLLVVAYYSAPNESSYISRVTNVQTFTTPATAYYIRVSSNTVDSGNTVVGFYDKAQIEKGSAATRFEENKTLKNIAVHNAFASPSAKDFAGHRKIPYLDAEYCQVICYGQSLSVGADSQYVTDPVVENCYVLGTMATPSASLVPMQLDANGQYPIVSAINSLQTLLIKNGLNTPKFLVGSYGAGGQSIAQLMSSTRQAQIKTEEEYEYNIDTSGKYQVFLNSLTAMKSVVGKRSVSCPAIVFLQGERDYFTDQELTTKVGSDVHAYACGDDKAKYKKYLGWLKDDMQNACCNYTGQATKPLFVIYQCSGTFISKHDMGINMAQQEFAAENPDVILLPAPYFTPNYGNGHLSTNGYRWLGEYIGQALFAALAERSVYKPILPCDIWVEGHKVHIKVTGATLPMKLDAYTVEQASENGFRLWRDETKYTVLSVEFHGDEIVLATGSSIDLNKAGSVVEVSYAGYEVDGTGNVRDSAVYGAMYNYWDDEEDDGASGSMTIGHRPTDPSGDSIVGAPYPMWNWLSPFYWTQTNPS